ncbi:Tetratricopeptide repeat-containing protein [Singulisphaera sp. GP187]|uniref:tetratricopeptide repeat protein n=1 Tax=Singulisphaera sp. GP187 TaxID=1882752 RepID=UPI000929A551|nr:tetratricopeptide repeat protein [Singulisphaera sp. GP187]SIO55930.1 Tetratricopeptide repeat-containing protein [Singulisphaera sp. GP187]
MTTDQNRNREPAADAKPVAGAAGGRSARRRIWAYRLASLVLGPVLFLGLLETGLGLAGYGHPTSFFLARARAKGATTLTENPEFGLRFFPPSLVRTPLSIAFPTAKPAGTCRVFVLGESAAMGIPDPSTSFARVLEVMLRDRFPQVRFEVINTAMVAINSHAVVDIARECARHQPDLFVVLLGNNEVVGPFGAAGVIGPYAPSRRLIRASLWVKDTRLGQLMSAGLRATRLAGKAPRYWDGMAMFQGSRVRADDPRLRATYAHFRANLGQVCEAGLSAGAKVVVCTVPVNLADCPPFASEHATRLTPAQRNAWETPYREGVEHQAAGQYAAALDRYDHAARIDDTFAALEFQRGQCLRALGRDAEARPSFSRARDLDALRFRADSTVNAIIRQVAASHQARGVSLVDAEREFATTSPNGLPGKNLFHEHVHMTFSGNYQLASGVFRTVAKVVAPAQPPEAEPPSESWCAERLAYTRRERTRNAARIHEMLQNPPFTDQLYHAEREAEWEAQAPERQDDLGLAALQTAVDTCRTALQASPDDWMLRIHYAYLLTELGAPSQAALQYEAVIKQRPFSAMAIDKLATLQLKAGEFDEAAAGFEAALAIQPGDSSAAYGRAEVLAARGKIRDAIAAYEAQVAKQPDRVEALRRLAGFLNHLGKPNQAQSRLEEALRLDPNDPLTRVDLGNALAQAGDLDGAIAQSEAALRLRPHWPEMTDHLAALRKTKASDGPGRSR